MHPWATENAVADHMASRPLFAHPWSIVHRIMGTKD